MQLRPRCTECRSANHLVCPPVQVPIQAPVKAPVQRRQQRANKCCSFCSRPGHYKPKCEKYKSFIDEIRPTDVEEQMIILVQAFYKNMQDTFIKFLKSRFPAVQVTGLFNAPDEQFKNMVRMFIELYEIGYFMPKPKSKPKPKQKIQLKLCKTSATTNQECGICLSEDVSSCNMVKFGCGHDLCGDCAKRIIDTKPCCAFCRADITKVSVNSQTVFDKLIN
jgi:hypothetical protein